MASRLNGHEFDQTPGDGERQGSLVCCSPQGHKESDTTAAEQQGVLFSIERGELQTAGLLSGWVPWVFSRL